ncbi:MAG: hypothetical protein RL223_1457 [Pseudomonadota bacterium]|jgi:CheY-like chemotaxis protein
MNPLSSPSVRTPSSSGPALPEALALSLPRPRVLLVDDLAQNRLALRALLDPLDVEVLEAGSGEQALELLLAHEDVALALLDVQMPQIDGFSLAELMRGAQRTRHIPIMFLTAGSDQDRRSFRGYEAGAVDFLFKPLDPQVLRSKVQVFLALDRQRRELAQRMLQLQRMSRLNGLMLSTLTHDLKAPIAALSMNAELLQRMAEVPAAQRAGARIKSAAGLLARQLDHLVALSHLPEPGIALSPERLALDTLLEARLQALHARGGLAGGWQIERSGDLALEADRARLEAALDALLLPAAALADEQPLLLMLDGSGRRSLGLTLLVDGLPGETAREHLFGSGVAVDGLALPQLGVGLQAVERLVRSLGGSLVGRCHPREGTRFELLLPRSFND